MKTSCKECGQINIEDSKFCVKCGSALVIPTLKVKSKLYGGFSIASLSLGGLVAILLGWLDMIIVESQWALNFFAGHYGDRYYIIVICAGIYLLFNAIGIVLGSISIKKGYKIISIIGLVANVILILAIAFRTYLMYMVFFVF